MNRRLVIGFSVALAFMLSSQLALADGPTPAQVSALARQLDVALRHGDVAAANQLFDIDALSDRASAGVAAPAGMAQGFRQGMKNTMVLMKQIAQLAQAGQYHFLRVHRVGGETRALFRLLQQNGLNYHDWIVGTDAQGQLKFVDVYIAVTGETMGQTIRRTYVMAVAHANPTLIERLTGSDRDFAKNIDAMHQIAVESQAKKYNAVLNTYRTLPKSLQEDKSFMVMRLSAAANLREQLPNEYESAMEDFARLFPGDPCLDLVGVDALINQKKYREARQSIDRLEAFTGGDPYLGVLRGNIDIIEGGDANFAAARNEFETAKATEPMLAAAYWGLLSLDLKLKDYDRTAAELTEIQHKLHIKIAALEDKPLYAGFVQSDAYRKWKASQAAN